MRGKAKPEAVSSLGTLGLVEPFQSLEDQVIELDIEKDVLVMGCGSGCDTLYARAKGHRVTATDITEQRSLQERLSDNARTDTLTRLPNRKSSPTARSAGWWMRWAIRVTAGSFRPRC